MKIRISILLLMALALQGCKTMEKDLLTPVKSVTITPVESTVQVGETMQLTAVVSPADATVREKTWRSLKPEIASIDENGLVQALSPGWTVVSFTVDNVTGICKVTVSPRKVTSLSVSPSALKLTEGESFTLTATVLPEDAAYKALVWSSSDPSVATVDNGRVKALSEGKTIITVQTQDGTHKATCDVEVIKPAEVEFLIHGWIEGLSENNIDLEDPDVPVVTVIAVESVSLDATSASLFVGGTLTLTATVLPEDATDKTVSWSSSQPSVVQVEDGVAKARSAGSAVITVTTHDGGFQASCTVEVQIKNPEGGTEGLTEEEVDLDSPPLRVGILGDSISTFEGAQCNPEYNIFYPTSDPNVGVNPSIAVDSKVKLWWWRLIYDYMPNGVLDANSSWGGTRVVHEVKKGMGAGFVDRAYDFVNPDIIIIHGGTNDHNQSTPLGEYGWDVPVGEGDLSCFRGAYVQLVKMLQERYEGVQLILIIGDRLSSDYEDSIKEIAQHFGLPYVDFVGDDIPKCSGSHPTAQGHAQMASKIWSTCRKYLQ